MPLKDSIAPHTGLRSVLILSGSLFLSACGGGSGSGGAAPTDDSDGGTSDATGYRIQQTLHDVNNNGLTDAISQFSYTAEGHLSSIAYRYTGDGTGDRVKTGLWNIGYRLDRTDRYNYVDGRLVEMINEILGQRGVHTFNWESGLVRTTEAESFDTNGALMSTSNYTVQYTNGRVSGWAGAIDFFNPSDRFESTGSIAYDGNNQPTGITSGSTTQPLTWQGGRMTGYGTPGQIEASRFEYVEDRVSRITVQGANGLEVYDHVYDESNRLSETRHDYDRDGRADDVTTILWETGPCRTAMQWAAGDWLNPELSVASGPYVNGSGYGLYDSCATTGHVR